MLSPFRIYEIILSGVRKTGSRSTYTYDALNRVTGKSYTGVTTPSVKYGYDGSSLTGCSISPPSLTDPYPINARTAMCDGSGATSWSHDQMGRILSEDRTIATHTNTTTYAYNLDGSLSTLTYPNTGKIITYAPNSSGTYTAGRPASAKDVLGAINYVTSATYAPQGALASLTNGSASGFAGIVTTNAYNARLQPLLLSASSPSGTVFSLCFDFHLGLAANNGPCSFSASALGDDGNVYQIVNNRDTTRTENFTYDSLNRIASGYSSGTQWGETFTIDPWGNLTNRSQVTNKSNYEPLSASASTKNQLSGFNYDAAGNMTQNGSSAYTYDAENRLINTAGWTYVYDGNGQRAEKTNGSTGTLYWRNLGGETLDESDLSGNPQEEYVYFNSQRVARRDVSANAVHYYFSDHLGSHGVVENATGSSCEQDIDYYPYGGVEQDHCGNPPQNYKFTAKERDSESGLDYFGARHYASALSRFTSPDKFKLTIKRVLDPQGWNSYQYTRNTPSVLVDPDGNEWTWAGARNVGNAQSLVFGLAQAYMTNGRFQKNFDAVAKSKTTVMAISDRSNPVTHTDPVTSYTPGETGILPTSIKRDGNGTPTGASDPVHGVERIDVQQSHEHSDIISVVKHETEHSVQINSDPVNYEREVETNGQNSKLETEALSAGNDSSQGQQMTFGEALQHVMEAVGVTWEDLGSGSNASRSDVSQEKPK
jgi:RHS repeat-associated protein